MATRECRKCDDVFTNKKDRDSIEEHGICNYCYKHQDGYMAQRLAAQKEITLRDLTHKTEEKDDVSYPDHPPYELCSWCETPTLKGMKKCIQCNGK